MPLDHHLLCDVDINETQLSSRRKLPQKVLRRAVREPLQGTLSRPRQRNEARNDVRAAPSHLWWHALCIHNLEKLICTGIVTAATSAHGVWNN